MSLRTEQRHKFFRLGYYVPWAVLYLFIVGGTTTFAAVMLTKYEKQHLPSGSIELSVDKSKYQQGEVVEFTVTNHFPVPVYVTNQCPREPLNVYRWQNTAWVQIHATAKEDGECYTQERDVAVASEATRSYNFSDWPDLFSEPGVYRIAAVIDHYSEIPFQDFVVLEPAEVIEVVDAPQVRYAQEAAQPVRSGRIAEPTVYLPVEVKKEKVYEDDDEEDEENED